MSKDKTPHQSIFARHPKLTLAAFLLTLFAILSGIDFILGQKFLPKLAGVPNAFYHHDLKKNNKTMARWGDSQYPLVTNSLGFKDKNNRIINRQSKGRRILFIGDSFTEGVGFPWESTFAGYFQQKVRPHGIEVLNAAVKSYSPKLYYLKTKYLIENLGLRFDELFVFVDISDVQDEIVYQDFHPRGRIRALLKAVKVYARQNFFYLNKAIYQGEQLQLRLMSFLDKIKGEKRKEPSKDRYDFWARYHQDRDQWLRDPEIFRRWGKHGLLLADQNMEKLSHLCRENNIKMHIVVYPWPFQILAKDRGSLHERHWQQFAHQRNIGFLNLYPFFINDIDAASVKNDYFCAPDIHFNAKGHEYVADILYKYWKENHSRVDRM